MDPDKARTRLEQERARLQELLDSPTTAPLANSQQEDSSELSSYDQHPADAASDTLEREQALGIAEHAKAALLQVEDALRRVEAGEYGRCTRCGQEIPAERLEERPESPYCVEHQRELERSV
jgi:DnaK suppressor protein